MPEIKERPIRFNDAMVRAILDDRKTVTRRVIKPQPDTTEQYLREHGAWVEGLTLSQHVNNAWRAGFIDAPCPFGEPGARLWVQEAWAGVNLQGAPGIAYRADDDVRDLMKDESFLEDGAFNYSDPRCAQCSFAAWSEDLISGIEGEWLPNKDMPRWASRILLEVTDVRVERLQDITGDQAIAEGIYSDPAVSGMYTYDGDHYTSKQDGPIRSFAELWNTTGGDWDANPWVWVVSFRRATP